MFIFAFVAWAYGVIQNITSKTNLMEILFYIFFGEFYDFKYCIQIMNPILVDFSYGVWFLYMGPISFFYKWIFSFPNIVYSQPAYEKRNITNHQGNANQSHNELSLWIS